MSQVDRCVKEDIPAVARIHMKTFASADEKPTEGLKSYYETIFFDNPWYDEELPSLVFRSDAGNVEGFLGVLTRRMNFQGKSIRVAIPHRLMVAPDCSSPMAAMHIIKTFLAGPQDLVLGDGANDLGRKFMEGMGASTAYVYSMSWLFTLRPGSYMRSMLGRFGKLKLLAPLAWPMCSVLDSVARKVPQSPLRLEPPGDFTEIEMDCESVLSSIAEFSKPRALRPEYTTNEMKWLWDFLKSNTQRGQFRGFEVRNGKDKRIGTYLYYLTSKKVMEVMLFLARKDSTEILFSHLLYHALQNGAICVTGRVEPKLLQSIGIHKCLVKRGNWAVVHAKDPEIINVINRGEAMLSMLEGELWLRSPHDRL